MHLCCEITSDHYCMTNLSTIAKLSNLSLSYEDLDLFQMDHLLRKNDNYTTLMKKIYI